MRLHGNGAWATILRTGSYAAHRTNVDLKGSVAQHGSCRRAEVGPHGLGLGVGVGVGVGVGLGLGLGLAQPYP